MYVHTLSVTARNQHRSFRLSAHTHRGPNSPVVRYERCSAEHHNTAQSTAGSRHQNYQPLIPPYNYTIIRSGLASFRDPTQTTASETSLHECTIRNFM